MATRRIEIDDAVRLQMSVRLINEGEIEKVVNDPQQALVVRRKGQPIDGRWLYWVRRVLDGSSKSNARFEPIQGCTG